MHVCRQAAQLLTSSILVSAYLVKKKIALCYVFMFLQKKKSGRVRDDAQETGGA